jgi:hypothetical protein
VHPVGFSRGRPAGRKPLGGIPCLARIPDATSYLRMGMRNVAPYPSMEYGTHHPILKSKYGNSVHIGRLVWSPAGPHLGVSGKPQRPPLDSSKQLLGHQLSKIEPHQLLVVAHPGCHPFVLGHVKDRHKSVDKTFKSLSRARQPWSWAHTRIGARQCGRFGTRPPALRCADHPDCS